MSEDLYLDNGERKIFFFSPRGFTCRALPQNVLSAFAQVDVVCTGNQGRHFGRGIVRDGVTVSAALEILAGHNVLALPAHRSTDPVPREIIEQLQEWAPDFNVLPGHTTREVVASANAARGFPPFALAINMRAAKRG